MKNIKRKHSARFKKQVVLELLKGEENRSQVCSRYSIHPTQAARWQKQVLAGIEQIFTDGINNELKQKDELIEELYKQVGQLKVELDWLKKKIGYSRE